MPVATTVALRSTLQCRRPRLSPLSAMNFEMAKLLPVRRVKRFPTKTARECSFPAARLWPERDSSLFSRRKCNGRQPSPTHRWRRLHRARAVTYFGERSFLFAASPGNRRWRRPGSAPVLVESTAGPRRQRRCPPPSRHRLAAVVVDAGTSPRHRGQRAARSRSPLESRW
jgi:hypothetical protein